MPDVFTARLLGLIAAGAIGAALAAAACHVAGVRSSSAWIVPGGLALGLALTTTSPLAPISWGAVPAVAGLSGAVTVEVRDQLEARWLRLLLLVSLVGLWAGPPENDHVLVLGGATAVALGLDQLSPHRRARVGVVVGGAVLFGWAALVAGATRFHPTVGGALCIGALPLAWIGGTSGWLTTGRGRAALLVGHATIVVTASRLYAVERPDVDGLLLTVAVAGLIGTSFLLLATAHRLRVGGAESP